MFSSLGLFKKIACPEGEKCQLPVCIFFHDVSTTSASQQLLFAAKAVHPPESTEAIEPPKKKQRLGPSKPVVLNKETEQKGAKRAPIPTKATSEREGRKEGKPDESSKSTNVFEHLRADVSPPPLNRSPKNVESRSSQSIGGREDKRPKIEPAATSATPKKAVKKESLNPRSLPRPPAAHAMRFQLLRLIHEQMVRLNEEVKKSAEFKEALQLSPEELIRLALDEEERTAKTNPTVYPNVMKLRVVALKRLKLEGWKAERLKQIEKDNPEIHPCGEKRKREKNPCIETKLSKEAEIALLPNLITSQTDLDKYGYVPSVPSSVEIEEARKGIEAAKNWEVCDRCKTRFQVFPGRRESDGALTTGGTCTHHWGRVRRPAREKGQSVKPEQYTCCQQEIGTLGCTTSSTHVFKISEAKRLALVLPFEKTPVPLKKSAGRKPICFDCEMGYTTYGMELIRLTAVSWPSGGALLDVLVRPLGEVLDLNSRFSGVWPETFTSAKSWTSSISLPAPPSQPDLTKPTSDVSLCIVPSPVHARSLLFSLLTPDTPLIGHALENDLNAMRIVHPTIIDTVLLYPHPAGLPARYGLKNLVKKEIEWEIQTGGELGHDSLEDSRAAGELVRLAVKRKWEEMAREGWKVEGSVFHAP
ncbi:MAG: hypothetical protein LQ340_005917 [Diploschistes diacapsis]|nr:MAG: hypothetical protein LQ340_005917 [Diploschistes diacapsis]